MIHPLRDSLIALFLTLSGLAALAYGGQRLWQFGENDVPGGIAVVVGGLTAFFCVLMLANFLWAVRVTRRILRGEGVIACWTVPAETVDAYRAAERARPRWDRSRWRPKPGTAAEVIFTADAVMAGGRYHGLSSSGTQHFVAVQMVAGNPGLIQFTSREITASPSSSLTWYKSVLRLPVARGADEPAGKVYTHFRQVLSGQTLVKPDFWTRRIRIGRISLMIGVVAGGVGWALGAQSGWQIDDTAGMTALVLMIAGAFFGIIGLSVTLIASAFRRQQKGR
jgi:hypothetical protein